MKHLWITNSVEIDSGAAGFEQAAEWAATQLKTILPAQFESERAGLYIATRDAGASASISFWKQALEAGAGFANPHDFPWTLASSPAGYLALQLQLRGPNYTLVGAAAASQGVLQHAFDDLAAGRVNSALAVRLDLTPQPRLAALWLADSAPARSGLALDSEMYLVAPEDDVLVALCKTFQHRQSAAALVAG